jgi:nitroreductase
MNKIIGKISSLLGIVSHCQRNWIESKKIPEEHLNYIIEACTDMPTKQQKDVYSLVAITDRKIIMELFETCYEEKDYARTFKRNTQVLANLLLVWIPSNSIEGTDSYGQSLGIAVGISAAAAALAGAELGYRTGFCRCINEEKSKKVLESYIGKIKKEEVPLMLGIGIPDEKFEHNVMAINGARFGHKISDDKPNRKVYRLA